MPSSLAEVMSEISETGIARLQNGGVSDGLCKPYREER